MRAVLYIRVSSEEQVKEGFSIDAQLSYLQRKCEEWGYTIVDKYIDDGVSAKNMNRKALQQLFKDAESGKFDVVIYWRLDRLTRSSKDFHKIVERLNQNQVGIKSGTEQIDTTTAIGRFQLELSVSLAQLERETISERVSFVMEEIVRSGKWHGGPVPFGYHWDGTTMHIVPEEAEILRELRRIYMSGEGFGSTANILNTRGLKRREGLPWSDQTVQYVLENPFYAGKIRYGSKNKKGKYVHKKKEQLVKVIWSDTDYPQVYTWEEYEEHSARIKKRQFYGVSKKREYWFTGVLRCARCGNTMIGRPKVDNRNPNKPTTYIYYICSNRTMRKGCDMPLYRQSVAASMIMDYIRFIKISHDELETAAKEIEKEVKSNDDEIAQLRKSLKDLADRRKKWQYMLAEDLISETDYRQRKREEDEKESILLERIEELKAAEVGVNASFAQLMYELPDHWSRLEDGDKKDIMQTIFQSIVVDCDMKSGAGTAGKGRPLQFRIVEVNFN